MYQYPKTGYGLMVVLTSVTMVYAALSRCCPTTKTSLLANTWLPGHAGAMLQARRLGNELLVGIHSDEAILENKGPTVMTLKER